MVETVWEGIDRFKSDAEALIVWLQEVDVEPSSPLALDDNELTARSARDPSLFAILSSLDHIRMVCDSVRSMRGSLPFAHATPLRTAIECGCLALWLLSDDRPTRCLMIHLRETDRLMMWLRDVETYDPVQAIDKSDDLERSIAEIELKRQAIVNNFARLGYPSPPKVPSEQGIVIEGAKVFADRAAPEVLDGWDPGKQVVSNWRTLSAYAHGFRWASEEHATKKPADNGYEHVTIATNVDWVTSKVRIAAELAGEAARLFGELAAAAD